MPLEAFVLPDLVVTLIGQLVVFVLNAGIAHGAVHVRLKFLRALFIALQKCVDLQPAFVEQGAHAMLVVGSEQEVGDGKHDAADRRIAQEDPPGVLFVEDAVLRGKVEEHDRHHREGQRGQKHLRAGGLDPSADKLDLFAEQIQLLAQLQLLRVARKLVEIILVELIQRAGKLVCLLLGIHGAGSLLGHRVVVVLPEIIHVPDNAVAKLLQLLIDVLNGLIQRGEHTLRRAEIIQLIHGRIQDLAGIVRRDDGFDAVLEALRLIRFVIQQRMHGRRVCRGRRIRGVQPVGKPLFIGNDPLFDLGIVRIEGFIFLRIHKPLDRAFKIEVMLLRGNIANIGDELQQRLCFREISPPKYDTCMLRIGWIFLEQFWKNELITPVS